MNIVTSGIQEPDRLAPSTLEAMRLAQEEAIRMQAQAIYPEHLLLGVIAQGENKAARMLCRCGMDMQAIRVQATGVFGSQYAGTDSNDLSMSGEALECIEWAVLQSAWVLPEHLVLSVLHHPRMHRFLSPFSASLDILQGYLTKEINPSTTSTLPTRLCPSCRKEALPHWKHCAYCGASLVCTCSSCGSPYPDIEGAQFCFECGSSLE